MRGLMPVLGLCAMTAVSGPANAGFLDLLFGEGGGYAGEDRSGVYSSNRALYPDEVPRSRVVPFEFRRQTVSYQTNEKAGTIVIDTKSHFLYFVLGDGRAIRYGVGVGRTGFGWKGTVRIGNKAEWPGWTPPPAMIAREAKRGNKLPAYMPGGPDNPLGARALYLYREGSDTGYRIHGTSEPWTIGLNVSSGCIRLNNTDVTDLYERASVGAKVIVL
jgi:lipoprotein-anchoring transpeptidase ErfK/SrfK